MNQERIIKERIAEICSNIDVAEKKLEFVEEIKDINEYARLNRTIRELVILKNLSENIYIGMGGLQ